MERNVFPDTETAPEMIRDLVLRMGADENAAEICAALIRHNQENHVCLPLSPEQCECVKTFSGVAVAPEENVFFILDGNRFYTRRFWKYEKSVRENIQRLLLEQTGEGPAPEDPLLAGLHARQQEAVQMICRRRFSLLTGGPGTGKTFTIARAVRWQLRRTPGCRLGIAAPTGKAAARVREAMAGMAEIPEKLPCSTIHALLQKNGGGSFGCGRENPLPLDWLIIDESSMIDLPLMAKLLEAVPDTCRLTLAGDAHQLSSVEAGKVFGDLCRCETIPRCELDESSRFPPGGEIDRIARWINSGEPEAGDRVLEILHHAGPSSPVRFTDLARYPGRSPRLWGDFEARVKELFAPFFAAKEPKKALAMLSECRLLCPFHQGPFGTETMNDFLSFAAGPEAPCPMMITRNDRDLGVHNGDVGVVMPGAPDLILPGENGGVRRIPLELLPQRERAFASTVHKAQGSEYRNVMILLPPAAFWQGCENAAALLTREILYTAVTRTKEGIFLYADAETIRRCCLASSRRDSGPLV